MNRLEVMFLAGAAATALAACGDRAVQIAPTRERPAVCTTLYPVHYFVQRIAGDLVDAACAIPTGADPLAWRPDRATIAALQDADLVVLSGAGAEAWADQVSLPASRLVVAARALREEFLEVEEAITHSHGGGSTHKHHGTDPHLWMDPALAIGQAEAIATALRSLLPDHTATLDRGLRELRRDLDALGARLRDLGPQPDGEVLAASHPAYDYLARRHGWRMLNLDLDPARALAADELATLRAALAAATARIMLWERPPAAALAAQIEALGLRNVVFAPCETVPDEDPANGRPAGPDYLAAMNANVDRLAAVWRP